MDYIQPYLDFFAAHPGLLVSTERDAHVVRARAVDPDVTCLHACCETVGAIGPGLEIALTALIDRAAGISRLNLGEPQTAIGRSLSRTLVTEPISSAPTLPSSSR